MTTNETYTLSLHDALPIWTEKQCHCFGPDEGEQHVDSGRSSDESRGFQNATVGLPSCFRLRDGSDRLHCCHGFRRSEEHTSELQSLTNLVCRLLLEKKKKT